MSRIVCAGEGMLELSRDGDRWRLGYGGDTLNTAIHLARMGHEVAYLTALGSDPFSLDMKRQWQAEGLDVSLVLTHPDRHAGLYAISVDASGERSFTYWRETSAARDTFALPESDRAIGVSERADLLFFSLITLAILPPEGRGRLLALAAEVSGSGGKIAFDGNYRARLWSDHADAAAARDEAIACADFGLPTLSDEQELGIAGDAAEVAAYWRVRGCGEVVVKLGAEGCLLPDGSLLRPGRKLDTVDTSGAGDAFNAGYLAARLRGEEPAEAARRGHELAAWAIMRRGAIPPRDAAAPYG